MRMAKALLLGNTTSIRGKNEEGKLKVKSEKSEHRMATLNSSLLTLPLNKLLTSHLSRYGQAHDLQYRGSHVGEDSIGRLYVLVLSHVYEGHGVE